MGGGGGMHLTSGAINQDIEYRKHHSNIPNINILTQN